MTEKDNPITDPEDASWHDKRREGVGGSDVSKILGLESRFTTPAQLWELKTGRREPEPAGPAAARGHKLEPWILKEAQERLGVDVVPGHDFMRHPEWPRVRIQANTDGTILYDKAHGLFEAKTVKLSEHPMSKAQDFLNHYIPTSYMLQVQAYLACTGYRWGIIAAAIGPAEHNDWEPEHIQRFVMLSFRSNPEVQRLIAEVCVDFWACVEEDKPPGWTKHPLLPELMKALGKTPVRPARSLQGA